MQKQDGQPPDAEARIPVLIITSDETRAGQLRGILTPAGYHAVQLSAIGAALEHLNLVVTPVAIVDQLSGAFSAADVEKLVELFPELKIIQLVDAVTGTGPAAVSAHFQLNPPIQDATLLSAVRAVIDNRRLRLDLASIARELEHRERDLRNLNLRLSDIVKSAEGLVVCTHLAEMAETVLRELGTHMAAEGGSIYMVHDDALILLHSLDPGHAPGHIERPLPEDSVFRRALREKRPIMIHDIEQEHGYRQSGWQGYKGRSLLVMPLLNESGEVPAIVSLHSREDPPFTDQDCQIALIIASHACETLRALRAAFEVSIREDRLRTIFENLQDVYYEVDMAGRIIELSPSVERVSQFTREELLGTQLADLYASPDDRQVFLADLADKRIINDYQVILRDKDGTEVPCAVTARLLYNQLGAPWKICGTMRDIRARARAEEALRISEERLQLAVIGADLGIWDWDLINRTAVYDDNFAALFGLAPADLPPEMDAWLPYVHNDDLDRLVAARDAHIADRTPELMVEFRIHDTNGVIKWAITRGRVVQWDEMGRPTRMTGVHRDITERKQADARLASSEARLHAAQRVGHIGSWELDLSSLKIWASPEAFRIYGFNSEDDTIDLRLAEALVDPADRPRLDQAMRALIEQNQPYDVEFTIHRRVDGQKRTVHSRARLIKDDPQEPLKVIGTIQDVTERRQLEVQLQQAQKMEAIGVLAGGIAHDFNNLLFAIRGNADLALDSLEEKTPEYDNLQQIVSAGQRAAELVKQILSFARQTERQRQPLKLSPIIKEVCRLLGSTLPATISVEHNVVEDVAVVADPTEIHQVLMNLCTNAGQAMLETGGRIVVGLDTIQVDGQREPLAKVIEPGAYARLRVADTGPGISAKNLSRIFEPFFTTKEVGSGTGMGLAVAHSVVTGLGGAIEVESELGSGAVFSVFLPLSTEQETLAVTEFAAIPGGTERLMIVDDEPSIARMARSMLSNLGYEVAVFTDSEEALAAFSRAPHDYDLLLTDQTMPGLTGSELAQRAMAIRADLPVVLCTGFSHTFTAMDACRLGIREYLLKPLTRQRLATMIRKALDTPLQDPSRSARD
ncbi:PAS domain S-box protein [bacterium]|nr:PAS domain S-box protein [bacterium]